MVIDELLVGLGFVLDKNSQKNLKNFQGQLKDTAKLAAKLAAGFAAGTAALTVFVSKMAGTIDETGKVARSLGLTAQELDNIRFAMDIVNGSSSGLERGLLRLGKSASEFSKGKGENLIETFGQLNVGVVKAGGGLKGTSELLLDVLRAARSLEDIERIELLSALGLRKFNLAAIDFSDFEKALEQAEGLSRVTKVSTQLAANFNDRWLEVTRVIKGIAIVFATALFPAFNAILVQMKEWLLASREGFSKDLIATAGTLSKILAVIFEAVKALASFTRDWVVAIGGLNTVLKVTLFLFSVILGLSIIKTIALAIPLIVTLAKSVLFLNIAIGAIPGILLVIIGLLLFIGNELIRGFFGGDENIFENILKRLPDLKNFLEDFFATITSVAIRFIDLIQSPLDFTNWKLFFDAITTAFSAMIKRIGNLILLPARVFAKTITFLREASGSLSRAEADEIRRGIPRFSVDPISRGAIATAGRNSLAANGAIQRGRQSSTLRIQQDVNINLNRGFDQLSLSERDTIRAAIIEQVSIGNRQALRDIETGIVK